MKLIPLIVLLACGAAAQNKVPVAASPDDVPVTAKSGKGPGNELEGISSGEAGVLSLGKYLGGSWSLKPSGLTAYVNEKEIVLVQNKHRFAIPVKSVTEILYGNAAHSRVGQDAGIAALTGSGKNQPAGSQTDVGIVWKAESGKSGIVVKIDKGDFPNCMNALQAVTGLKAIDAESKSR